MCWLKIAHGMVLLLAGRTFKVATHRAADTGFCWTCGLWLEGSAKGQLTAALHQGAARASGPRPQAPGPSELSDEPALARPQKSPVPRSDGGESDLGRGTRPHPGGRSITDTAWRATWACAGEAPAATHVPSLCSKPQTPSPPITSG